MRTVTFAEPISRHTEADIISCDRDSARREALAYGLPGAALLVALIALAVALLK